MSITFLSQLSLAHISIVPPVYVCGVATMGRIYLLRIPERLSPNVPVAYVRFAQYRYFLFSFHFVFCWILQRGAV